MVVLHVEKPRSGGRGSQRSLTAQVGTNLGIVDTSLHARKALVGSRDSLQERQCTSTLVKIPKGLLFSFCDWPDIFHWHPAVLALR